MEITPNNRNSHEDSDLYLWIQARLDSRPGLGSGALNFVTPDPKWYNWNGHDVQYKGKWSGILKVSKNKSPWFYDRFEKFTGWDNSTKSPFMIRLCGITLQDGRIAPVNSVSRYVTPSFITQPWRLSHASPLASLSLDDHPRWQPVLSKVSPWPPAWKGW